MTSLRCLGRAGFTLVEMLVVASLVMVGAAVTIPVTARMVSNSKADSAMVMTASFLQAAHNRAIAERRNIQLNFMSNTSIQLQRVEVPSGALTVVDTLVLEGDAEFVRAAGLVDTPDALGGTGAVNFTGTLPVMFTSDGSLIDSAGDVTNGTIFVANPKSVETSRAVTIWGVTGLSRSWKWRNTQWQQ